MSVVAYILTVLAMPIVGLVVLFITVAPVAFASAAIGPAGGKAASFLSQGMSAFAMVGASRLIFGAFEVAFTPAPVVLVGVILTLFNLARVAEAMRRWSTWLEGNGLPAHTSGEVLATFTETDETAYKLHYNVGHEMACAAGSLAGVVAAGTLLLVG